MSKLDFPKFNNESDHLKTLLDERDATIAGRIPLGISFLDDSLGGVYPKDLFLIGAGSGIGKTSIAVTAATSGIQAGKSTYMFALEAERGEITQRVYFQELAKLLQDERLDFAGWVRGDFRQLEGKYHAEATRRSQQILGSLQTLYKARGGFTPLHLGQQLEAIAGDADLIVVDHLHIIDAKATESENRVQQEVIAKLADIALVDGKAVVAVSHLRKQGAGQNTDRMPTKDDFHGHSDIYKKSTCAALIATDWDQEFSDWNCNSTFMQVCKDRKGRASGLVSKIDYVRSMGAYKRQYALGRMKWSSGKQHWEPISRLPYWAKQAETPEPEELL